MWQLFPLQLPGTAGGNRITPTVTVVTEGDAEKGGPVMFTVRTGESTANETRG